mmetsp:Transcript_17630/g.39924  ORF Transcript_17630/g.39924 Transcript_17630/m.39924 type:complete len:343 (-) Transcript_17630:915-1943(-)
MPCMRLGLGNWLLSTFWPNVALCRPHPPPLLVSRLLSLADLWKFAHVYRYAHCSLILGPDKIKLSKRHGATSCGQFKEDGFLPDAMINYLSLLGWNDGTDTEIFTREELIDAFDINRVVKSPSIFDMAKLRWINGQHLKMMSIEEVVPLVHWQLKKENVLTQNGEEGGDDGNAPGTKFTIAATTLAKQMMETTKCAATNAQEVLRYGLPPSYADLAPEGEEVNMIHNGHFYAIGSALVRVFEAGEMPLPDPARPSDAFLDGKSGEPIVEDNQTGGNDYSFPAAYKAFMKSLAKQQKVKVTTSCCDLFSLFLANYINHVLVCRLSIIHIYAFMYIYIFKTNQQ